MSYTRVLPRDLFNEANLLKCYGRLWICLENRMGRGVEMPEDVERFEIVQRTDDGWTYIENLPLKIGPRSFRLVRPLNSRQPWPLFAEEIGNDDAEPIEVFDGDGDLSEAMLALLDGQGRSA